MWESPETFLIEIDEGPGVTSYTVELAFEGHQVTVEAVGASFTGTAQT
jgi:hypothetical protein